MPIPRPSARSRTSVFFRNSPLSQPKTTRDSFKAYVKTEISLEDIIRFQDHLKERTASLPLLIFNKKTLWNTNPVSFNYMTDEQLEALKEDLILAFHELCIRYQANAVETREQYLSDFLQDLERCGFLIRNIELAQKKEALEVEAGAAKQESMTFQHWCREQFELALDTLKMFFIRLLSATYLIEIMSDANIWRLYWVWTGNMLRTAAGLFPAGFHHIQQTQFVTTAPQPVLGYISWILYYVRFSINFMLILKHTIIGPWMNDAEINLVRAKAKQGVFNRFQEQLAIKKFSLINDLIWASTNLVTALVLIGPSLGPLGDLLTVFLLVGDASLSLWAREEAEAKHKKDITLFDDEIKKLKEQLSPDALTTPSSKDKKLMHQIERLQEALAQCRAEWKTKSKKMTSDLYYGAALLTSFAFMVFPWVKVGVEAAAGSLVMASAGLCFVLSLIYSSYRAYSDVTHARESRTSALLTCQKILEDRDPSGISRVDYLRYQDLIAEANHQDELADYQLYVFIRAAIVQALIPLIIFSAFTFATFGIGAAVFAASIVVAVISHYVIEEYKPRNQPMATFSEKEFQHFNDNLANEVQKMRTQITGRGGLSLFSKKGTPEQPEYQPILNPPS